MLLLFDVVNGQWSIQIPYFLVHRYCRSICEKDKLDFFFPFMHKHSINKLTSKPHKLRDNKAQMNDFDKPNSKILVIVPIKPCKITGLLPIRSDNIPQ